MPISSPATCEQRRKGRPRSFDHDQALQAALLLFWRKGYAPTSVAELCKAMGINPPSLYADFGNKASLFIEAVHYYERTYWDGPGARFLAEADVYRAVADYFATAARILRSPETPCGCMLVLAAVNIDDAEEEIIRELAHMRRATQTMFEERLSRARTEGQIPEGIDIHSLACALNTFLEGLSLAARDEIDAEDLAAIAAQAVRLLPPHKTIDSFCSE